MEEGIEPDLRASRDSVVCGICSKQSTSPRECFFCSTLFCQDCVLEWKTADFIQKHPATATVFEQAPAEEFVRVCTRCNESKEIPQTPKSPKTREKKVKIKDKDKEKEKEKSKEEKSHKRTPRALKKSVETLKRQAQALKSKTSNLKETVRPKNTTEGQPWMVALSNKAEASLEVLDDLQ